MRDFVLIVLAVIMGNTLQKLLLMLIDWALETLYGARVPGPEDREFVDPRDR